MIGPLEREKKALAPLIRGYHARAHGWRVTTSAPGADGTALDEDAIREDYAARGVPIPEVAKPGASPRLTVTRLKAVSRGD